jgi:hypothetical protein
MKIKNQLILLTTISIAGCGLFDKKEVSKIDDSKTKSFILSSNANSSWDTTFTYVFELQEQFENSNTTMCFTGEISDLIRRDSSYVLKLSHIFYHEVDDLNPKSNAHVIAYVRITPEIKNEILTKINDHSAPSGAFNLRVSKIKSSTVGITPEIEGTGDDAFPYLYFEDNSPLYILEAELVNYQLDELKNQDE